MTELESCDHLVVGDELDQTDGDYETVVVGDEDINGESEVILNEDGMIITGVDSFGDWSIPGTSLNHAYLAQRLLHYPTHETYDSDAKIAEIINDVAAQISQVPVDDEDSSDLVHPGHRGSVIHNSKKKQATIVQCQYCGVFIKHPSKIQAHLRTHTGEKPFECEICGMRFTQRTPMRMHVRRHVGDTPFVCSWGCGKKFVSNALKNAHEVRIHLGEKRQGPPRPHLKPPRRSVPLAVVETEADERSHVVDWQPPIGEIKQPISAAASKKLDEVIDAVAAGVQIPPPRKSRRRTALVAQCQQCGLILKHPSKIQAHMRTHTGERPFECGVCGMRFATANPLRVHLRRAHTGEKPFECTWECGRRFVSISARNEHERIVHVGLKRYQCVIGNCRRLFTRRRYLLIHQEKEHDEPSRRAMQCVLNMVEREMHHEKESDEDDAIAFETETASHISSNQQNRFIGEDEEPPFRLKLGSICENDFDDRHELAIYDDDIGIHIGDGYLNTVNPKNVISIDDDEKRPMIMEAIPDEQLSMKDDNYDDVLSDNLFDDDPSSIYLSEETQRVIQDYFALEQSTSLHHYVETRNLVFPTDDGTHSKVGRVKIVKPFTKSTVLK